MEVEAIRCDYIRKPCFSREAMQNMKKLRILCYYYIFPLQSDLEDIPNEYLPKNLCYIDWFYYPWKSLPENFNLRKLVHLDLQESSLHHLWNETKQLPSLRRLNLRYSKRLKRIPDFTGMSNLEFLDLSKCMSLEEVHHSLRCSKKLIELNLSFCKSLEMFPYVNVESLESLNLENCCSLEKFPEILGIMKPELKIIMSRSGIRELPSSIIHLTELNLSGMENLVSLPSSICKLKGLVKLHVSHCSKLERLPEEIGDLENLEYLDARCTLISRPPSSIVRLNKLKLLLFGQSGIFFFVFPHVNEGLRSLEVLDLSYCNLIDGGLPEDIGCLSSLKELDLSGNSFEYLPRSIAQLGALRLLDLSDCKRLTQLPQLPQQLETIDADWSNDSICNSLFQNISSLQHDISASHSLSLRVFNSKRKPIIPSNWFHHQGMNESVSVNLPENWYISDKFLGFAVFYSGYRLDITAHLIPLCDDGMSSMTQEFALSNHSESADIHFFLIPLGGIWDASKANGKTPNDYGCIRLYSPGIINDFGKKKYFGVRLLYKDETEFCIGIRRSRYEEVSCSSSKKQRSQVD